jgi:hypothetical protein
MIKGLDSKGNCSAGVFIFNKITIRTIQIFDFQDKIPCDFILSVAAEMDALSLCRL